MRKVERLSDLGGGSRLIVMEEDDGDLWVSTVDDKGHSGDGAEFCTTHAGGGRSPFVRAALKQLMAAIVMDNEEHPI